MHSPSLTKCWRDLLKLCRGKIAFEQSLCPQNFIRTGNFADNLEAYEKWGYYSNDRSHGQMAASVILLEGLAHHPWTYAHLWRCPLDGSAQQLCLGLAAGGGAVLSGPRVLLSGFCPMEPSDSSPLLAAAAFPSTRLFTIHPSCHQKLALQGGPLDRWASYAGLYRRFKDSGVCIWSVVSRRTLLDLLFLLWGLPPLEITFLLLMAGEMVLLGNRSLIRILPSGNLP